MNSLEWLIAPLDRASFERRHYEQRLCIIGRGAPNYYDNILTAEDLDRVLCANLSHREVDLVREGQPAPRFNYTTKYGWVDPLAVRSEFADGATLIFQQLHLRIPSLARLCVSLGSIFSSRIQTNVYLTPANGLAGFRPHWDTHDVFVLQIMGTKRWSIHGTETTLPLRGQECVADDAARVPVSEELVLTPGDALYIPRGLIHAARTGDEASLHITLGVTAVTWADFLLEGVAAAALNSRALRRNLPIGFAGQSVSATERERIYREQVAVLLSNLDRARLWKHFEDEVAAANRPLLENMLSECLRADALEPETLLRRKAGVVVTIEGGDEHCVLAYGDREMRLPARVGPAVEFVVGADRFAARHLPDCLDMEGKLLLARKLLKEGVLEFAAGELSHG